MTELHADGNHSVPGRAYRLHFSISRLAVGLTCPTVQWVSVIRQLGHDADCSPVCSAEVKSE